MATWPWLREWAKHFKLEKSPRAFPSTVEKLRLFYLLLNVISLPKGCMLELKEMSGAPGDVVII